MGLQLQKKTKTGLPFNLGSIKYDAICLSKTPKHDQNLERLLLMSNINLTEYCIMIIKGLCFVFVFCSVVFYSLMSFFSILSTSDTTSIRGIWKVSAK